MEGGGKELGESCYLEARTYAGVRAVGVPPFAEIHPGQDPGVARDARVSATRQGTNRVIFYIFISILFTNQVRIMYMSTRPFFQYIPFHV